jgi:sec-independent protein translocase protein TatA
MFRSPVIDGLVIIVVLLLIVGPKKLPQMGRGLGEGMREFKDGITGGDKTADESKVTLQPPSSQPGAGNDDRPAQAAGAPGRESGSERSA